MTIKITRKEELVGLGKEKVPFFSSFRERNLVGIKQTGGERMDVEQNTWPTSYRSEESLKPHVSTITQILVRKTILFKIMTQAALCYLGRLAEYR